MVASTPSSGFQPAVNHPCEELYYWNDGVAPSSGIAPATQHLRDWNPLANQPGYCSNVPVSPLFFKRRYGNKSKMMSEKKVEQPIPGPLYPIEALKDLRGKHMTLAGIYVAGAPKCGPVPNTSPPMTRKNEVPSAPNKTAVYHSRISPLPPAAAASPTEGAALPPSTAGAGASRTKDVERVGNRVCACSEIGHDERNNGVSVLAQRGGMLLAGRCIERESTPTHQATPWQQRLPQQQQVTGSNRGYSRRPPMKRGKRSRPAYCCGLLGYLAEFGVGELN